MILALLEWWRPEPHTFDFPTSECTIMLEDVSMLLGLCVNGLAITDPTEISIDVWIRFLGCEPPWDIAKGRTSKFRWIKLILEDSVVNGHSTVNELIIYIMIYNLLLIALSLMLDKSSKTMHNIRVRLLQDLDKLGEHRWGLAVLAYIFREMCKGWH